MLPVAWTDRFHSLGWRILLWMSLIALGPLMVMAIQGYHCAREAIVSSEVAHLESVLQSRAARIDAWLAKVTGDLRFLGASPCVRGVCGTTRLPEDDRCAGVCNLLDDLKQGSAFYDRIGTYDASWRLLVASSEPGCCAALQPSAPERAEVAPARSPPADPELQPSGTMRRLLEGTEAVVLGAPKLDEQQRLTYEVGHRLAPLEGSVTAFVAGRVIASQMLDPILTDRTGLGQSGRAYLITPAGAYAPNGRGPELGFDPARAGRRLWPGSEVRAYRAPDGRDVLGVAARLPDLGALLVVEVAESEAFAWLRTLRMRALVTGALTLAVVLVLATQSARTLASPLKELAAVARRVASGKTDERVRPLEGREAADVAQAFNGMLDELDAIHARLQRQASLAAIGELSSSVVHEMRNPLSSIKMNLQALERVVAGDPTHAELARIASQQALRLERMLGELLGYGRPLELHLAPVGFADLVADVREATRNEAQTHGVTVEIEDRTEGLAVLADPEQLRRALINLLTNAIQATPWGRRVRLIGERDTRPGGGRDGLLLQVRDEGGGIPETAFNRLFEPFFTTREEGTGLGLANVKKIVDYHGGAVRARNRDEGGAEFTIWLPQEGAQP